MVSTYVNFNLEFIKITKNSFVGRDYLDFRIDRGNEFNLILTDSHQGLELGEDIIIGVIPVGKVGFGETVALRVSRSGDYKRCLFLIVYVNLEVFNNQ